MRIGLNGAREKITIERDPDDDKSVSAIYKLLKDGDLPFRTIDGKSGIWEASSPYVLDIERVFETVDADWSPQILERIHRIKADSAATTGIGDVGIGLDPNGLVGPVLYPEQERAASYMAADSVNHFGLFWAMGTGKTGALIAAANNLVNRGVISGVLIVAERPVSMEDPWRTTLEGWLGNAADVALSLGSKTARTRKYLEDPTWLVVHYGQLKSDLDSLVGWAQRKGGEELPLVIFDESDFIKNPKSNRSMSARELRRSFGRCWIASGTPAPNSPADYQHQLEIMRGYPVDIGLNGDLSHDADVVSQALKEKFYYLQQDNPRKMPESFEDVPVVLNPTQRSAYSAASKMLLSELQHMDDDTFMRNRFSILGRRRALLRICSDPSHQSLEDWGVPGVPDFNDPSKVSVIDGLLEKILEIPDEKVVIWSRYRSVAKRLHERYRNQYGASLFIGGEGDHRDLALPGCRVLVATLQKGSSSISLTMARNAIYESMDDMARNFSQSLARINRSGQSWECRYWILCSQDTLEEDVLVNTRNKLSTSQAVLEDIGIPGRAQLIEELKKYIKQEMDY